MLTATQQLPVDPDGNEYGTAQQVAERLTTPGRPITAERVRDWARRARNPNDRLHGLLPATRIPGRRTGTTYYLMRDGATVELITRPSR